MLGKRMLENELVWKPIRLIVLFILLAVTFWYFPPGYAYLIWWILVACAAGWLIVELLNQRDKDVRKAAEIGVFLMLFDFFVENLGKVAGFWTSYNSVHFIIAVPLEVMLLALLGGTAWALYQPKRFNGFYILFDIAVFAFFGTLGEHILGVKGLLIYAGSWTSLHAFLGYAATWTILHSIVYLRGNGIRTGAAPDV